MRNRGFTLIELMIVVAIVGVLAVVAVNSYGKYMANARKSEVMSVFAEIRAKQEAYRAEFSSYRDMGANEDAQWPVLGGCSEPCPKKWQIGAPQGWVDLGINPGKSQLYCGYAVVSGPSGDIGKAGGLGNGLFGGVAPQTIWWYAVSRCDNNPNDAKNTTYATSFDRDTVFEENTGR